MTSGTGSALTALVALPRDVAIRLDSLLSALVHHHTTLDKPQERAEAELLITAIRYAYEHSHADDLARLVGAGELVNAASQPAMLTCEKCGGSRYYCRNCRCAECGNTVTSGAVGAGDARPAVIYVCDVCEGKGWQSDEDRERRHRYDRSLFEGGREFEKMQAADRPAGIPPQEG